MFSDSRNSVNNRSVVGKTLNSTGRRMYIATIITTTDIMMSVTMRRSRAKGGSGVMRAMTIPSTASGTPTSRQVARFIPDICFSAAALPCAKSDAPFPKAVSDQLCCR